MSTIMLHRRMQELSYVTHDISANLTVLEAEQEMTDKLVSNLVDITEAAHLHQEQQGKTISNLEGQVAATNAKAGQIENKMEIMLDMIQKMAEALQGIENQKENEKENENENEMAAETAAPGESANIAIKAVNDYRLAIASAQRQ